MCEYNSLDEFVYNDLDVPDELLPEDMIIHPNQKYSLLDGDFSILENEEQKND